jgi:hypothetical protein
MKINPRTGNPIIQLNQLENNYSKLMENINKGNLVICQFNDGTCVLLNNTGITYPILMITYNPKTKNKRGCEIPVESIKSLYDEVLNVKELDSEFFMIENNEVNMIYYAEDIVDSLMCMKNVDGEFNGYKMRVMK